MSTGSAMALWGRQVKHHPAGGMLAASWNLHTKFGWSSPAREVIVKCSADKYLYF